MWAGLRPLNIPCLLQDCIAGRRCLASTGAKNDLQKILDNLKKIKAFAGPNVVEELGSSQYLLANRHRFEIYCKFQCEIPATPQQPAAVEKLSGHPAMREIFKEVRSKLLKAAQPDWKELERLTAFKWMLTPQELEHLCSWQEQAKIEKVSKHKFSSIIAAI